MDEWRLAGIKRGLEALDARVPMAPTMDGRLPLHQDCRELVAEVERLRSSIIALRGRVGTYDEAVATWWIMDQLDDLLTGGDGGR